MADANARDREERELDELAQAASYAHGAPAWRVLTEEVRSCWRNSAAAVALRLQELHTKRGDDLSLGREARIWAKVQEKFRLKVERERDALAAEVERYKALLDLEVVPCVDCGESVAWPRTQPDPCHDDCVPPGVRQQDEAVARLDRAVAALRDVLGLIDTGYLVRDTSRDHEEGWALKQVEPVGKLAQARAVIAELKGDGG